MNGSPDVGALFDAAARDYDQLRRKYIPGFDEFYGWVVEVLPFERDASVSILDLGAGTGLLTALLAEAYPNASFTLLDVAPQMLERARERFGDAERFSIHTADYTEAPWPGEGIDYRRPIRSGNFKIAGVSNAGRFDAVVSALSLHHIGPPKLQFLFAKARSALKAGGIFVNADQVLAVTPEHEAKLEAMWLNQVRALGCTEDEIKAAQKRMEADDPATLEFQLEALRRAGFNAVECWYKNGRFAVYSGVKP